MFNTIKLLISRIFFIESEEFKKISKNELNTYNSLDKDIFNEKNSTNK
jgi:hypothetical protein